MSDVKSKNLFELLGNTSDQDSDRENDPVKTVDKAAARSGKRDVPKDAPTEPTGGTGGRGGRGGGRRGGFTGSEEAFRDRNAGRDFNRRQPVEGEEGVRRGRDSGPGSRRGGRGPRGPRRGGDRQDRTGQSEHVKQSDQAWGQPTGEGEFADEQAGTAMANQEIKEDGWADSTTAPPPTGDTTWNTNAENPDWKDDTPAIPPPTGENVGGFEENTPAAEPEPEDTHKSYSDYLAEQATKRMEGLGLKEARQPNEGAKENKKWKDAKALERSEESSGYFQGKETKQARERDRTKNAKEALVVEYNIKDSGDDRRGRGRGRGRGPRGERGEYRGRGGRDFEGGGGSSGYRGGRGGGEPGERSEYRGGSGGGGRGRGGRGRGVSGAGEHHEGGGRGGGGGRRHNDDQTVAVDDETAFPSLGGGK